MGGGRGRVPVLIFVAAAVAGSGLGWTARQSAVSPSSSAVLGMLPDGPEKRRFLLDCTGCHQLTPELAFPDGEPRPEAEWRERTEQMLGFAGAHTEFPVIAADREPAETARWLAANLRRPPAEPVPPPAPRVPAQLREYDYPYAQDLPHDLAVDRQGGVWITGMFTHRLLRLDPETGEYREVEIPVANANPRALDIDGDGRIWALLGAPLQLAGLDPATGEWRTHDIGMYPHSIALDGRGRIWFNGHFSRDPEQIGYVERSTGAVRTIAVPTTPELTAGAGPIPYGLRVGPDGTVWGTELQGNRIFRFDPERGAFRSWAMPTPHSGPRRPDVADDGALWIPEYANNALARLDPETGRFTEYRLPIADALPYVVRIDHDRDIVWIGTGGADAVLAFDPERERFDVYPTPTRGALIRHIDVDPRNGDLWAAYGASPGIPPKILRVRRTP